jgi:hypothetical protein
MRIWVAGVCVLLGVFICATAENEVALEENAEEVKLVFT